MARLRHPFALVVVGKTGAGKSTTVKNILKCYPVQNVFVYDVNNEYNDEVKNRVLDLKRLERLANTRKNSLFIFEEATIFFNLHRNKEEVINFLIRRRHLNNSFIFVFHSLRSLPVFITDFITDLYIFQTNDRPELLKQKFKGVFTERDIKEIKNIPKYRYKHYSF